jgi:hypothetical protein
MLEIYKLCRVTDITVQNTIIILYTILYIVLAHKKFMSE